MTIWILIGMVCASGMPGMSCYEVKVSGEPRFESLEKCQERRDWMMPRTAGYFALRCQSIDGEAEAGK